MSISQLVLVKRNIRLGGVDYGPGEVVDLAPLKLASGRLKNLLDLQRVELITSADDVKMPDTYQAFIENAAIAGGLSEPPVISQPSSDSGSAGSVEPGSDGGDVAAAQLDRVAELSDLPKDDLLDMARATGVAIRGSRREVAIRIANAERGVTS